LRRVDHAAVALFSFRITNSNMTRGFMQHYTRACVRAKGVGVFAPHLRAHLESRASQKRALYAGKVCSPLACFALQVFCTSGGASRRVGGSNGELVK